MVQLSRFFILIIILAGFSCTPHSTREENTDSTNMASVHNDCRMDAGVLQALKMLIPKDTGSQIKIDSTAVPVCVKDNSLTVYFVKTFEIEDGYIAKTGYIGFCTNDLTNQHSGGVVYFSEDRIALEDSTWHEPIRLLQGAKLSLRDLDGDEWPELIVKERLHNGTLYDAVVARIYHVDPATLSLHYTFSIEEISWLPFDEAYVKRILQGKEVHVYLTKDKNGKGEFIGRYSLDPGHGGKPFNVVTKEDRFKEILFTSSPLGNIPEPD